MRAHELQDLKTSNKKTYDFRKRYHKLYYHFKPQKVHWMLVIILRKLGIAVAGLMLRANPSFQLAVCLCILFVCYVLQVKHRPFMSTSERTEVIKTHRDRVIEYDRLKGKSSEIPDLLKLHKRMDGHMKTALHAEQQSKLKKRGLGRSNSIAARMLDTEDSQYHGSKEAKKDAKGLRREAEKSFYFDYNTVETGKSVYKQSFDVICIGEGHVSLINW